MRKLIPIIAIICFLLPAYPVFADEDDFDFDNHLSVGLGGGFGDNDVGPGVLSGKYWDTWMEIGAELFWDNDQENQIDQLVLAWFLYRHNLHEEVNNTPWIGVGFGDLFEKNAFQDSFGFMSALGWEGRRWGMEFKWGHFDPSLYSFVVYYHF